MRRDRFGDGGYRAFTGGWHPFRRTRKPLRHANGGHFVAFGIVEREMLVHYGLRPEHSLVDVGCGAGRLTAALRDSHRGPYLGTDVVPALLREAARMGRKGWRFERGDGFAIPVAPGSADFVCFFSVFTHLLDEHVYLYLEAARTALKPGGRIVLSFLEYRCAPHWNAFAATVDNARRNRRPTLNTFTSREALAAWAEHLGLETVDVRAGDDRFVPLPHPIAMEDGTVMEDFGCLGQSICVLAKPLPPGGVR
jgi:SAM-dependent methyltransferase